MARKCLGRAGACVGRPRARDPGGDAADPRRPADAGGAGGEPPSLGPARPRRKSRRAFDLACVWPSIAGTSPSSDTSPTRPARRPLGRRDDGRGSPPGRWSNSWSSRSG